MESFSKLRIVAAGRGRSMCAPAMRDTVLDLVLPPNSKEICLVYLGTPSYDKDETFQSQTHAYKEACRIVKLEISEAVPQIPSREEIWTTLSSASIILVSGGNTLYAINRWKQLGMDQMIRDLVSTKEHPPVLCGGSAGAICWFDFGHSDSMDPTTFLHVDPNLTEAEKKNWEYIRQVATSQGMGAFLLLIYIGTDAMLSIALVHT